ncbi:MAG: heavy metal translocating P-type ATPase [Oscillospiraceae bacterium]|nr:heavy metal translocating P-type ATPase [Oscillospiraceae bacterium]
MDTEQAIRTEQDNCGCGHGHEKTHNHEHEEHHHHGHDHESHRHDEGDGCCGPEETVSAGEEQRVYIVEGLDCPNCAAKIEARLAQLPQISAVSLAYATKQLRVTAANQDELLPLLQQTVDAVEDGVTLTPKKRPAGRTGVYILEGLDCPNCAAKIEHKLNTLPGVSQATVTYATLQLRLTADNPDALIPAVQQAIDAMEEGITVVSRQRTEREAPAQQAAGKEKKLTHEQKSLLGIAVGAVLFLAGLIMDHTAAPLPLELAFLIVAYLILGGQVLLTAAKNIRKGQVFDENFLMCIATLGAFAIQEFPEAVGVMLFYRIGSYFEERATAQSRTQIIDAVDLRPEVVNLVEGENVRVVPAEQARVGQVLLVRPGDRIPLDGVVLEGSSPVDTSAITGEPVPVQVREGDSVTSGCVNLSGLLKIRAEKPLEESMVTRILDSVENAAANKPSIDRFITRFARVYTPIVVLAAVVVALVLPFLIPSWHFFVDADYAGTVGVLHGTSGTASILTALTFLVISCPCALVLSVPLSFFAGIGAASKRGILFKGGNVLEALAGVRAVVMDKTGTITQGSFTVQQAVSLRPEYTQEQLLALCAGCEQSSTHPIAESILSAAKERGLDVERPSQVEELAGLGIRAQLSCGTALCGSRKLMQANQVDLSALQDGGFGTEVLLAIDGVLAGYVVISDALKEDAASAIGKLKNQGIVTAMLTGDAQDSADHVAAQVGLDEVHARLLPEEKLERMRQVRESHGSTMFVGDGINDAPVLAGADVGAAMGSGADAALEAADVVFMNSEVEAIPRAIRIARATRIIAWENVWFALAVKLVVMVLGLCGFANMWVAVFADTGVSMLCLLNSFRLLRKKF